VRRTKNLRRVSVSNWADKAIMAEKLGKDFIYSSKPNPVHLATATINEEEARKEAKLILETAKDNHLEMIMKDNHTLGKNRENVKDWVKIVREEMAKMGY
jgi:hypothetical protein